MAFQSIANSVNTSAALALLPIPADIAPGTRVYVLDLQDDFVYTVSTAALVADQVVACFGITGARWIRSSASAPVALPSYEVFADPAGSDVDGDGSIASPFLTLYAATIDVVDKGGGTIFFNDLTEAGGPVADQGLWLRNDDIEVPGFINMLGARLRFAGTGQFGNFVFQRPGCARIVGGSPTDHTKPGIWVVGSEVPIDFESVASNRTGLYGLPSPVRLGWDYARRPDFTLEDIDVTDAVRAARETVLTVDLTTATPWVITHADRAANDTVTLTLTRPLTVALSPWTSGAIIRVDTGGDTDFPNVDATVTGQSDVLNQQGETTIEVSYVQAGATIAKSLAGTVVSHGCSEGDRVMLQSNNAEFPTCSMMRVTDATVDTITVFDPYGYSPRSASASEIDIGTVVKQVRGRSVASGVWFDNSSFYGNAATNDDFVSGPTVDIGGTSAALDRFDTTYVGGGLAWQWFNAPTDCYDPDRTMVAIFADPGANTVSGASFEAYSCQSQSGNLRWNPHATEASLYVDQWLQDSAGFVFPTVVCGDAGALFPKIYLNRIANADADVAAIEVGTGYDPLQVQIGDVFSSNPQPVIARSGCVGPRGLRAAYWEDASTGTPSPWVLGWLTTYSGGLSTPHKNIHWATLSARLANQFPTLAHWEDGESFPAGITVTQDGTAPDGSASAFKIVNANPTTTNFKIGSYPFATWTDGDGVIFGAWTKFPATGGVLGLNDYSGGTTWAGSHQFPATRYLSSFGWQPIITGYRLAGTGGFAGKFWIGMTVPPGTSYVWLPTLLRSTAGTLTDDEFYEWGKNATFQPLYLPVGARGTPEGVKLIGHGGLGCSSASVTVTAPGTADRLLTIYGPDGTPLIKLHGQAP